MYKILLLTFFITILLVSCNNELKKHEVFLGIELGMEENDFNSLIENLRENGKILPVDRIYEFKVGVDQIQRSQLLPYFKNGELRKLRIELMQLKGEYKSKFDRGRYVGSYYTTNDIYYDISKENTNEILSIYTKKFGDSISKTDSNNQTYLWTKDGINIIFSIFNQDEDHFKNVTIEYTFDSDYEKLRDNVIKKKRNNNINNDI